MAALEPIGWVCSNNLYDYGLHFANTSIDKPCRKCNNTLDINDNQSNFILTAMNTSVKGWLCSGNHELMDMHVHPNITNIYKNIHFAGTNDICKICGFNKKNMTIKCGKSTVTRTFIFNCTVTCKDFHKVKPLYRGTYWLNIKDCLAFINIQVYEDPIWSVSSVPSTLTVPSVLPSVPSTLTVPSVLPSVESEDTIDPTCCICMDNKKSVVFFPCKHLCSCTECSTCLDKCPLCKTIIEEKISCFL